MEGYINENRWIDLSGLPRKTCGSRSVFDWKHISKEEYLQYKTIEKNNNIEVVLEKGDDLKND